MAATISTRERDNYRAFVVMRRQLELTLERRLQADSGISSADYGILLALFEAPEKRRRAGQLGDLLGWEKSRVSHQLTRMEGRGLVVREECDADGRGVWIVLTAAGSRAVLGATRDHNAALREYMFDVLSEEEQDLLTRISAKVLDAINPAICVELNAESAMSVETTESTEAAAAAAPSVAVSTRG